MVLLITALFSLALGCGIGFVSVLMTLGKAENELIDTLVDEAEELTTPYESRAVFAAYTSSTSGTTGARL